jgi:hypothetical protein
MSLLVSEDSVSAPRTNAAAAHVATRFGALRAALKPHAVPLFFCAACWALAHPYAGIVHDARIYIGRVIADLDPAGLGHDMMFAHDGQFAFSLFPLLIRGLVAHLGPGAAAKIVSAVGCLCSFAAALILTMQLVRGRAVWLIMVLASVLPHAYGSQVFQTAETMAVPRPFAEAAILLSLAALISGRPRSAMALVLVGFLLHPIMALPGVGVLAIMYGRDWRVIAAAFVAAFCALLFALLGVPVFDRLFVTIDSEWLDFLLHISSYLSPLQWTPYDWGAVVVQSASIAIAADLLVGRARRVFVASLAVGLGGLFAALLFGDILRSLLAFQMQFWRTIWLLAALAPLAYGVCVIRLGPEAARAGIGRVTLSILTLGFFSSPDLGVGLAIAALALVAHFGRPATLRPRYLAALAAAAIGLTLFAYAHALIDFFHFFERMPAGGSLALYCALRFSVAALPICLLAAVWYWAKPPSFAAQPLGMLGGTAAALAASMFWASLPHTSGDLDSGRDPGAFASVLHEQSGEVLWVGGGAESWYLIGRPQWASGLQAVSAVFSRPLAMLWRERAQVLLDNGLASRNIFEPRKQIEGSAILTVTREAVDALCARDDAPVAVIFPVEKNKPVAENLNAVIWTPPHPKYISDANDRMIWHEIDRYAAVPCASSVRKANG